MNIQDITLIYEYNYWANKLILDTAEQVSHEQLMQPTSFSWGSLHKTLVHMLDTEMSWRVVCRDSKVTPELKPEGYPDLTAVRAYWVDDEAEMWDYLRGLSDADVQGFIEYDAGGNHHKRVLWHCLYHLVNHGTQHRSECAAMLTDFGCSPGDIDFTRFLAERGYLG